MQYKECNANEKKCIGPITDEEQEHVDGMPDAIERDGSLDGQYASIGQDKVETSNQLKSIKPAKKKKPRPGRK